MTYSGGIECVAKRGGKGEEENKRNLNNRTCFFGTNNLQTGIKNNERKTENEKQKCRMAAR